MRNVYCAVMLVLLLFLGCAAKTQKPTGEKKGDGKKVSVIAKQDDGGKIIAQKDGWVYYEKVTAPGTRSEGRIGYLKYKNKIVPPCFHSITTPVGTYNYISKRVRWGHHGWEKRSAVTPEYVGYLTSRFKQNDLERGYYAGQGKKLKTPKNWMRVSRGILYYWVAPDKLQKLIKDNNFSYLHPYGMQMR